MNIFSLHKEQLKILSSLKSAMRVLKMRDSLIIVGSLGRNLAGTNERVGDIDVVIDRNLCSRFWDFMEVLVSHGLKPVWDILDRPEFSWDYCRPQLGHPLALTTDCRANMLGLKYANLDICVSESDLSAIPISCRWVHLLDPGDSSNKDISGKIREEKVRDDHRKLIEEDLPKLPKFQNHVQNSQLHSELNLYYSGEVGVIK